VREKHGAKHPEIEYIEKLFGAVAREMIIHMQKEEQILFPYIDALELSINGRGSLEPPFFQTVRNPMHMIT
jgi:regulator of cell morphogenesis and NO signaling